MNSYEGFAWKKNVSVLLYEPHVGSCRNFIFPSQKCWIFLIQNWGWWLMTQTKQLIDCGLKG